jgi:flavin reductase (DIM6/NTAB) family NADH-FMN oxidoreductase RutF
MQVDRLELRLVLSRFPTGVTVVGAPHLGGGVCGLTANAFTSASLDPPLILVCVDRSSNTQACIKAGGVFAVSVLAAGQEELARSFARKGEGKFDGVPHRLGTTGSPLVDGAVAWFECAVEGLYPGGDHSIVVGRLVGMGSADGAPLVFHRGAYTTPAG